MIGEIVGHRLGAINKTAFLHESPEDGGVVGGSRTGPVVTPHTLELTPRGRVFLQLAPPETARAYLPPEYRPGRVYSDTESEKLCEEPYPFA
ncbi:hypothetical protein HZH66_008574 [Vespula vulgaris]|uniref:Uncharacterized protein n=1 Tax=Vespula vulgaris TaxID=7454 RepID=A0A834JSG3_VESVU|nr:hypothetical protein HZH66_008574 [Vespula vulgaris]